MIRKPTEQQLRVLRELRDYYDRQPDMHPWRTPIYRADRGVATRMSRYGWTLRAVKGGRPVFQITDAGRAVLEAAGEAERNT